MAHENLATYLNDHLAGSVIGSNCSHSKEPLRNFFKELRADITADRASLKRLSNPQSEPTLRGVNAQKRADGEWC